MIVPCWPGYVCLNTATAFHYFSCTQLVNKTLEPHHCLLFIEWSVYPLLCSQYENEDMLKIFCQLFQTFNSKIFQTFVTCIKEPLSDMLATSKEVWTNFERKM